MLSTINLGLIDTGSLVKENKQLQRDYDNLVKLVNQMDVEVRTLRMVTEKQIDELAKMSSRLALAEIRIRQKEPDFDMKKFFERNELQLALLEA